MARKTLDWLQVENGGVPAYLDIQTGKHGFENSDVYYDVTSSGMYRSLCQWLGNRSPARRRWNFLRRTQDHSGGWYWGVTATCFIKGVHPVSTGLVVQALARPEWLVEIDGTAVIPD